MVNIACMYTCIGATNFAIGIDLSTISSMHEVGSIIKQYEREMQRWRRTVVDDDTVIISSHDDDTVIISSHDDDTVIISSHDYDTVIISSHDDDSVISR